MLRLALTSDHVAPASLETKSPPLSFSMIYLLQEKISKHIPYQEQLSEHVSQD
jgi:hypothetical protein